MILRRSAMDIVFENWIYKLKQRSSYRRRRKKGQNRRESYNVCKDYRPYEDRNGIVNSRSTEEPRYNILNYIYWLRQIVETLVKNRLDIQACLQQQMDIPNINTMVSVTGSEHQVESVIVNSNQINGSRELLGE